MLMPQSPARATGWKPDIDNTQWLVVKVCHTLEADRGLSSRIEMEMAGSEGPTDTCTTD